MRRFENKSVIVTGAASGIGRAAALAFAEEGARLVLADMNEAQGLALAAIIGVGGTAVAFVKTDVADNTACQTMVRRALTDYGRLDIAFNNAGIGESGRPVWEESEAEFDRVIAVNLKSIFLCMRHEIAAMKTTGGGVIVNTASVAAMVAYPGSAAYCASKHGVLGLTRAAALDCIASNIRINALCPGGTRTPMLDSWFENPEVERQVTAMHPIGRMADPAEVARVALFLASEDSSYMVGAALNVDGGLTVL